MTKAKQRMPQVTSDAVADVAQMSMKYNIYAYLGLMNKHNDSVSGLLLLEPEQV